MQLDHEMLSVLTIIIGYTQTELSFVETFAYKVHCLWDLTSLLWTVIIGSIQSEFPPEIIPRGGLCICDFIASHDTFSHLSLFIGKQVQLRHRLLHKIFIDLLSADHFHALQWNLVLILVMGSITVQCTSTSVERMPLGHCSRPLGIISEQIKGVCPCEKSNKQLCTISIWYDMIWLCTIINK